MAKLRISVRDNILIMKVAIRHIEVKFAYSTTSEYFIEACNAFVYYWTG
jgi:hypothetical protein